MKSEASIKDIINLSHQGISKDADEAYNLTVKDLYISIVEFLSIVKMSDHQKLNDELFALRSAGRDIIEAIKSVKPLQKNFDINIWANNTVMRTVGSAGTFFINPDEGPDTIIKTLATRTHWLA